MPSPGRRWLRRGLVATAVALALIGGVVAFVLLHAPGNVSNPNLSFTAPSPTSTASPPPAKRVVVDSSLWPRYGFDAARTRLFPAPGALTPPLRVGWRFQDFALLEFPPVIYGTTLFFIDDDGSAKAMDKRTGHVLWERKIGHLAAASPALGVPQRLVFFSVLSDSGSHPGNGQFVALSMRTGRIRWSHPVTPGTESSALAWGDTVYFGDNGGTFYALSARTGRVQWIYHASAAIKGGPALANGIIYFGDYAGRAYALNAANGHQLWAVSTNGARFGFGSGNFYSTPAVAFGRVYMGNTDGRVYSFAARTGQLAWATGTGAYVYASAAVAEVPGLGPTVFIGSYDGSFYAFNAQSGSVRWRHPSGGRISGSPTIVGNVVYYAVLGTRTTLGLDIRTGRVVFSFPDGAFNPVIADAKAIYLSGYSMLYQMLAQPPAPRRHRGPVRRAHANAHKPHAMRHHVHPKRHHRAANRHRRRRR